MGCNCKKKNQIAPAQAPVKIILTENHNPPVPPVPPPPPTVLDPADLINKLNQILKPQ